MMRNKTGKWFLVGISILFAFVLTVGISGQGYDERGEDPPDKDWLKVKSAHYALRTTATEADGRKLLERMELVYTTFAQLMGYTKGLGKLLDLKVYKNRNQFVKGGAPASAGAFYSPDERYMCGFFSKNKERIYNFFAHEGIHQFHHMSFGIIYEKMDSIPTWYDEGIADCMGNSEVKGGKFRMCLHKGPTAQMRLPVIQRAIRNKKYYPIKDLLKMNKQTYYTNGSLCYAEGWSFVHFLLAYPKKEDKSKAYATGDYFYIMGRLFTAFQEYGQFLAGYKKDSQYKTLDDVYSYAFRAKDGKTPLNLDELEEKWKDYVLKFHYREAPDEAKDVEAETLMDNAIDHYKKGNFANSKMILTELKTKYAGSVPLTENLNDIDMMLNTCERMGGTSTISTMANEVRLFNGKDVANWDQDDDDEDSSGWVVKDGNINCDSDFSYLIYKNPTCLDFTLDVTFKFKGKMGPDRGSSFKVCSRLNEDGNYIAAEIDTNEKKATLTATYRDYFKYRGYSVPIRAYMEKGSIPLKDSYKEDDWNKLSVTINGTTISARLNDKEIGSDTLDDEEIDKIGFNKRGRIALILQDGKVEIKDITFVIESDVSPKSEDKPEGE